MRIDKQKSPKRPHVRSLKIQPRVRLNRCSTTEVPEIKLCGEWLHNHGFISGQRVIVTLLPKVLILQMEE